MCLYVYACVCNLNELMPHIIWDDNDPTKPNRLCNERFLLCKTYSQINKIIILIFRRLRQCSPELLNLSRFNKLVHK